MAPETVAERDHRLRVSERQRREQEEEDREKRLAEYEARRAAAIKAIEQVRGQRNPECLTLSEVVELLPDHPEWNQYREKKPRPSRQRKR